MRHKSVVVNGLDLLTEIEKRALLPEVDGQVGQVLAKGPDGTTSWIDGGGLPSGAKDGDIPIKSATVVGTDYNDDHTVLFLQNGTSNTAASDTPLPVAWGTAPAVQEDGSLLLTSNNQLSTTSNSAVASVFGGEFTVEAYLKPTQFNNTSRQDTNFFYLNGPSTYYIYLSNYADGGSTQNGKFGLWAYSGNRQIICNNNEYTHVAIDVYKEGTSRKYTIYYNGVPAMSGDWYNDGVEGSSNAVIRFFSSSDGDDLNNCYLKSFRVSNIARYKGVTFTPPTGGTYLPAPDGEWITINKSQLVAQDDVKLNPDPTTVGASEIGFSPALKSTEADGSKYVMPTKVGDVPSGATVQLNNSGNPVYIEADSVLLNDAKNVKLNQLDPTRQLPATTSDNVTPVYKKQDVIGAMYNDSKVVVLLQGSKTNTAKNAAFQLTGGDEVTVDSDGNLVFNRGNGIIVPADKFNNEANGQFTVDIMIAVDELPTSNSYEYIFGNDNSPTYPFNYRVHSDGTVRFQYQNTNHNIQIEKGIFALLSFDYDGTTLRSYKDGVLVGAQDTTYSVFPNTIGIGTDQYYQHTGFAGRIKYIRMSNVARYRGLAFTPPGLAGYITPPDGEWTTTPAIGDDRLLPNNPTDGDIPVYNRNFDKSNFNTTDTVCLLQNAGANQFTNVAKGKIGGSSINNYGGSVSIDENGYFVYPGGSGTWIEFIASGWNASGAGDWTLDVRLIAEATGSSQYFIGPANDGSGDPQAVIRGSGTTGTIQPYEISDMVHDITFGEEFTYSMAWEAATKTLRTWKNGKQMRKKTFTNNGYQFGFKGATEFWLGRNAVDPGLKGKVKYWRLSNAALYGDSEFTPPTDVYQDAPEGAWEFVNKTELGGSASDVDLSNYTGNVKLTSAVDGSVEFKAQTTGSSYDSSIKLDATGVALATGAGSFTVTGYGVLFGTSQSAMSQFYVNAQDIVLNSSNGIVLNGNQQNTAGGLLIIESGNKLPVLDGSQLTNLPDADIDWSNVIATTAISLKSNGMSTGITLATVNGEIQIYYGTTTNGLTINGSATNLRGGTVNVIGSNATLVGNDGAGSTTICVYNLTNLKLKIGSGTAASANTANGIAVVGSDGKLPSSIVPSSGTSYTKETINQADFATEDTTYGGKYKELTGICDVTINDADGYEVGFDVKHDHSGNKTRIYIPDSLPAGTITNWTLVYGVKTVNA